jgi:hypothetical protein
MVSETIQGKTTIDGKLYRVADLGEYFIVQRWTYVNGRTDRHHQWVRIEHRETVERVIAAVQAQQKRATA